jgi:hypothetical protein
VRVAAEVEAAEAMDPLCQVLTVRSQSAVPVLRVSFQSSSGVVSILAEAEIT